MENNKNHIDNFLSEKMQEMHFDVNEAHWKDAERRLDEKDDKKRPFFLLFLLGVLLIGLGTTAWQKFSPHKKSKAVSTQKKADASMEADQFVQTNYTSLEEDNSSTENYKNENGLNENNFNNSSDYPTNQNSLDDQGPTIIKSNLPVEVAKQRNNQNDEAAEVENTRSIAANTIKSKTDKQPSASKTKRNVSGTISKSSVKSQAEKIPTRSKQAAKVAKSKKNEFENVATNNTGTVSLGSNKSKEPVVTKIQNNKPVKQKVRIYKTAEEYQKLNPRYVEGLEGYTFKVDQVSLSQRISDSIREALATKKTDPVQDAKVNKEKQQKYEFVQKPSNFFILAGLAAARGYKGNSDRNAVYGLSPSLGVGYQYNFSTRMSLYLSLYMSYINHLNIKETSTNVTYSFDKDSTLLSVTRKNLMQLHIPLQLAYKLTPKHSIVGGLGFNLGLNTMSLYEDARQSGPTRRFGYTSGLRFLDVNANLGYEYMMNSRLSFGVFYQQGFMDVTKNNYFNNMQTDRNSRGGISLRYKFIK